MGSGGGGGGVINRVGLRPVSEDQLLQFIFFPRPNIRVSSTGKVKKFEDNQLLISTKVNVNPF